MTDESVRTLMILIALGTPLLALVTWIMGRMRAMAPLTAGRLWMMALVGPGNLVLWLTFNGYMDQVGHRSLIGIALALIVLVGGGFGLGFFRGRSGAAREAAPAPPEERESSRWFRP